MWACIQAWGAWEEAGGVLLAGENLITTQWIWLPLSARQFCWYSLPPGGPAGRAALSKWGWFTCIPLWYVFLTFIHSYAM